MQKLYYNLIMDNTMAGFDKSEYKSVCDFWSHRKVVPFLSKTIQPFFCYLRDQ